MRNRLIASPRWRRMSNGPCSCARLQSRRTRISSMPWPTTYRRSTQERHWKCTSADPSGSIIDVLLWLLPEGDAAAQIAADIKRKAHQAHVAR